MQSRMAKCLVVEKEEDHISGNVYREETEGIHVHKYGAHIFRATSNKEACGSLLIPLAEFNRYTNSPIKLIIRGKCTTCLLT